MSEGLILLPSRVIKSVAAVIALYNMRRAGVSVDDLMIVHNYISNEFADLIGVEPVA